MKTFLALMTFFTISACASAAAYKDLDVKDFAKLIEQPGVVILDVRTEEEFAGGHIPGAVNIDVNGDDFAQKAQAQIGKDAVVAVYCRSGKRSANACGILTQNGYTQVNNLSTGIIGWTNAGRVTSTSQTEDMIYARRSVRKYKSQRLDRDILIQILNSGVNAPNGQGRQAYEICVVDDPELLQQMSASVYGANSSRSLFYGAPCVVFIANDSSYDMSQVDCGLLGENIILSAQTRGIASICLGAPIRQMKQSKDCAPFIGRMKFSEGYDLLYCIALGIADEAPAAKARKPEKVRFM